MGGERVEGEHEEVEEGKGVEVDGALGSVVLGLVHGGLSFKD